MIISDAVLYRTAAPVPPRSYALSKAALISETETG